MMRKNRTVGLVVSLLLAGVLVAATIYGAQAAPQRHPFKWPDGKELKICFKGSFWDVTARKENVRKALNEWLSPDSHPAAGERMPGGNDRGKTNPNNDSVGEVMEDGSRWDLDHFRWPKVNRSFSAGEKEAIKNAYGTMPTWTEVSNCDEADVVFGARDLPQGHLGQATTTYLTETKVKTKSEVTFDSNPDQGNGEIWHHAQDGDGDGKITNNDNKYETGVPNREIDFYSVAKHEIGHMLSFAHASVEETRPQNTEQAEATEDLRTIEINPPAGSLPADTPNVQRTGSLGNEQMASHYTRLYFASDHDGYPSGPGAGGMDLWSAEWSFANSQWISITNAGPGVNTGADEITPFVGEEGALLVFGRGDQSIPLSFDLFMSAWDLDTGTWLPAFPMPIQGMDLAAGDEIAPTLLPGDWTLVFASNVSGTYDLWQSEFDAASGLWMTPTLLPGWANDPAADDVDPMLDGQGHLYFASDRSGGQGLFDIWTSELVTGQWQTPTQVIQANSPCDERDPYLTNDGDALYFSSNLSTTMGGPLCQPLDYDVRIADNMAPLLRVDDALDPIAPGSVQTYTLYYADTRPTFDPPLPVNGVAISAIYPPYTRFLDSEPDPVPGYDNLWGIGDLLPGQSGWITVTLWVSDTAREAPHESTPGLEHLRVQEMRAQILYGNPFGGPIGYSVRDRTWVEAYAIYLPLVAKNH